MKERPFIFTGDRPKLILDGRKTMTRRVVKNKFGYSDAIWFSATPHNGEQAVMGSPCYLKIRYDEEKDMAGGRIFPPWDVGDRLWVRETWATEKRLDRFSGRELGEAGDVALWYKANEIPSVSLERGRWRSFRFMPRWASRITLEITEVRVERLQEITGRDCFAEGIQQRPLTDITYVGDTVLFAREDFIKLWDSLNAKRGYSWDTNPWVWVIGFKLVIQ